MLHSLPVRFLRRPSFGQVVAQLLLALLVSTALLARPGHKQDVLNKPVTLKAENVALREVLAGLETQADVRFVHSPTAIQAQRRVSVVARQERLAVVLDRLLTPLSIDYSVVAGQIGRASCRERVCSTV